MAMQSTMLMSIMKMNFFNSVRHNCRISSVSGSSSSSEALLSIFSRHFTGIMRTTVLYAGSANLIM